LEFLTELILTNSTEVVVFIMAAYLLVSLVYVLLRETRLLHSPLVRCLVLTALVGGVSALAFGLLRHRYHDDAVVMPWVEHMTIQFAGVFSLAIVVRYCANRLRPHLITRPLVYSILQPAPYVMFAGWSLGALLLLFVPAPAPDLGTDLSLYGFTYRSFVQLPALFYAILSCGVWLWLLRNFGPASTPNELVLKKRLLPISVAMFSWVLLWADHLLWPVVALSSPVLQTPRILNDRIEMLVAPILLLNVASWLWALLHPYNPANLLTRKPRFQRYRALSETLSLVIDGPLGRHWRLKHHVERTKRLIEWSSARLGLTPATARDASRIYALATLITDPPSSVTSTNSTNSTKISFHHVSLERSQLEELSRLHREFLAESLSSPRRTYALEHPYPDLLLQAFLIVDGASPQALQSLSPQAQLAAVAAADAGFLPAARSRAILDLSTRCIDRNVLRTYLNAAPV
jgi:hypothetical protein